MSHLQYVPERVLGKVLRGGPRAKAFLKGLALNGESISLLWQERLTLLTN